MQSSLVGHKSYRSIPFNGSWSDLTGRLLRPKTPKNNLIAAALIPECPFHSYNLACLKMGGFLNGTLTHLLPDVAGQYCWDLEVYPVFCDGVSRILRWRRQLFRDELNYSLVPQTLYRIHLTVRETILLFFAPSNSIQREKQICSDHRGFPLNIFILQHFFYSSRKWDFQCLQEETGAEQSWPFGIQGNLCSFFSTGIRSPPDFQGQRMSTGAPVLYSYFAEIRVCLVFLFVLYYSIYS